MPNKNYMEVIILKYTDAYNTTFPFLYKYIFQHFASYDSKFPTQTGSVFTTLMGST